MDEFCAGLVSETVNKKNKTQEGMNVVYLTKEEQREVLFRQYQHCACRMYREPYNLSDYASRTCLPNGTWASHPGVAGSDLTGWTNYTACQTNQTADGRLENDDSSDVPNIFMENFQQLQLMYNIGYAISLSSLVVAFTIMIFFRKLHCSRNSIHLNLFASFILRAAISLIKDNFMVKGLGFPGDVVYNDTGGLVVFTDGPLNFISFINILRVLYTKLASNLCPDSNKHRHRRLARSTLFLVPTFGVYYIIFTIPIPTVNENVDFVMLFIEMFFNSFQGFFIALILCFINAERFGMLDNYYPESLVFAEISFIIHWKK
ncbi:PTH1R-like protein [Mya arenaria]|uniref:PTH1R-like protein n=1 Tax=Mya arenaria TaxID=6604 RepID=A0ABY7DGD4_MYAAR|nr:PTH1R-like protein [Mya arenaria]